MVEIRRHMQAKRLLLKQLLAYLYQGISRDGVSVSVRFWWTHQAMFLCWDPNRLENLNYSLFGLKKSEGLFC
jgi:hypothetical protein